MVLGPAVSLAATLPNLLTALGAVASFPIIPIIMRCLVMRHLLRGIRISNLVVAPVATREVRLLHPLPSSSTHPLASSMSLHTTH